MTNKDKLEALKTSVEMWVWDDGNNKRANKADIVFIYEDGSCLTLQGIRYNHYEPIEEPAYRAYREGDDISGLLGMKIMSKVDNKKQYIITGVDSSHPIENIFITRNWVPFEYLFENDVKLDGTPIGVLEKEELQY